MDTLDNDATKQLRQRLVEEVRKLPAKLIPEVSAQIDRLKAARAERKTEKTSKEK